MATEKRSIGTLKKDGVPLVGRVISASMVNTYVIVRETKTGVELRRLASREEPVEVEDDTPYEYADDVPVFVLDRDIAKLNHPFRWNHLAARYKEINQPF